MGSSLIEKFPHLKSLLQEEEDEARPSPGHSRKSLLGPGGPITAHSKAADVSGAGRAVVKTGERKPFKAEELFARSMGADRDHWLGFQVQEKLSARQQLEQLQVWLGTNKPSLVQRSSGVGWIAVKRGDRERRVKSVQAKAEWDGLEGEERTMETVNQLAAKFGDTGGKWLFHVTSQGVDRSWARLALGMLAAYLGPSVFMVKVSPRCEEDSHVIIVYNEDYRDTSQVTLSLSTSLYYCY